MREGRREGRVGVEGRRDRRKGEKRIVGNIFREL